MLKWILIAALVGQGFHLYLDKEMIFATYGAWLRKSRKGISRHLVKPLGACILCNTTWIGIILTILSNEYTWPKIIWVAIVIGVGSAGLVAVINSLRLYLNR